MNKINKFTAYSDNLSDLDMVSKLGILLSSFFKPSSLESREKLNKEAESSKAKLIEVIRKVGLRIDNREADTFTVKMPIRYYQFLDENTLVNIKKAYDIEVMGRDSREPIEVYPFFYIKVSRKE